MILFPSDTLLVLDRTKLNPFPFVLSASLNWPSIALGLFSEYTSKKH